MSIYSAEAAEGDDKQSIMKSEVPADAELIYLFSAMEIECPPDRDLWLADRKVVYSKVLSPGPYNSNGNIVSVTRLNKEITELAILSGSHSRFRIDPQLGKRFRDMYTIWIERSVNREIADEVLAYRDGAELGFVSLKRKDEAVQIGLIAVDEKQQGKNIGSALLQAAEAWAVGHGSLNMEVATQLDNKQACRFYEKNGYSIKHIDYIYHYYPRRSA